MIPITVPLIGGTITSVIYVLLVTPIVFEVTKQHELRTKGKIDLIDDTLNIISLSVVCFFKRYCCRRKHFVGCYFD
jgi:hypothetical protein